MTAALERGPDTLAGRFLATADRRSAQVAFTDDEVSLSYGAVAEEVARVTVALLESGVGRGDVVAMMLPNSVRFHVIDLAVLFLGAVPLSLYNSFSASQVRFVLEDSGATHVVLDERVASAELVDGSGITCLRAQDLALGPGHLPHAAFDLEAAAASLTPDLPITYIYTSGTTGPPKGVVLSHANVLWTVDALYRVLGRDELAGLRTMSYLPMAHIAERMMSHYQALIHGLEVTCCPTPTGLFQALPEVHPEILFGVPRIWEKLGAFIRMSLVEAGIEIGSDGDAVDDPTVQAVLEGLGLGQVLFASTGAAPIAPDLVGWFRSIGIPLSQVYGLSETTGIVSWTPLAPSATVGRPLPGSEVRLASDGELLVRGPNVFGGYLNRPKDTAEVLGDDAWLATGDVARIDPDGTLRIVDRKKELIVTAGGKNVSPANLEAALLAIPLIDQACVVGDRKPYVAAIVTVDRNALAQWAKERSFDGALEDAIDDPELRSDIERSVHAAMASFSPAESVRRICILPDVWPPGGPFVTPTGKLRRREVLAAHVEAVERLYR